MGISYRQIGSHKNGGYRVRRSPRDFLASFVWRWRLRQAIRLSDMSRQPDVIKSMHSALRENHPKYLDEWRATMREVGDAVDDLHDVLDWLREYRDYQKADRIRTIMARLARAVPDHQIEYDDDGRPHLIRDIARTYK